MPARRGNDHVNPRPQKHRTPHRGRGTGGDAPPAGDPAAAASPQTEGVDDLLDEIDGVLENNAEEFVRGFIQKGGQ
ncbi:ubiquitin-like protein Pup [Arthrobacter sp. ATA002]|uniref:ubiquitin-like protein Pup n=1 Tax=Arthrobacter sp. ATA002 TaxID=2991715 RepID=UPI0022A68A29|nr:ubiquitin-like protein Pup [Arthrobacter sp. ATA002]WAP53365.1 ubiquitin-like protein Pup [Arthrobacter sp. ATA002]